MYFHSSVSKYRAYNLLSVLAVASLLFSYAAPSVAYADTASSTPDTTSTTTPNITTQTDTSTTTDQSTGTSSSTPDTSGGATVGTGDSTSVGTVQNDVNTNTLDTDPATTTSTTTSDELQTSSTTPDALTTSSEDDGTASSSASTTPINAAATSTNDATVNNTADIEANTGGNGANAGGGGNAVVATGNATAVANVLNVVNTNIFDANGFFLFLNNLLSGFGGGSLDLRTLGFFNPGATSTDSGCSAACGSIGNADISNSNSADITNNITVGASTGGNSASSTGGGALTLTGNAYAAANVINVANSNILDSNYLLLTFNNFGNFNGDVVFPAAKAFLNIFGLPAASSAQAGGGTGTGAGAVHNTNNASVGNNVTANADTGGNNATSSSGNAVVATGNGDAGANVINQVNSNIFGANSFKVLFRIHGNWNGQIFGAPKGLTWQQTDGGIELFFDPNTAANNPGSPVGNLSLSNTNNAAITNNIGVYALTGDNEVAGGTGAGVSTGNAYADANVVNVANTDVIGRNWLLAIFDIFGNWNGNISFGRPDLWVGGRVETYTNGRVEAGHTVFYKFTVANNGDTDAHNVRIINTFDPTLISYAEQRSRTKVDKDTGKASFTVNIGTIPAGQYREFTYPADISKEIPLGPSTIGDTVTVTEDESDNNPSDNTDVLSFDAFRRAVNYMHGKRISYTPSPKLSITKTNSAGTSTISASSTVTYRVTIENSGPGPAYGATLVDILKDEKGNVLYEKDWDLGDIGSGEKLAVNYDTFFSPRTPSGIYTNTAKVYALAGDSSFTYGWDGSSNTATSGVSIRALPAPALADTSTATDTDETASSSEIVSPPNGSSPSINERSIEINRLLNAVKVVAEQANDLIRSLPLYSHPDFADRIPDLADMPLYLHPVYPPRGRASLPDTLQVSEGVPTDSWVRSVAGTGFLKLIIAPSQTISTNEGTNDNGQTPQEHSKHVLALLALSMFVLRPLREGSDEDSETEE